MPVPTARERIFDVAKRLFYRDGLRATGIDRIIAESGVAKMSLYRNFASKNALIAAFLAWRHEEWMAMFSASVETHLARGDGLAALAGALDDWFSQEDFRGCAFINAVAESGADEEPHLLQAALSHKAALQAMIFGLAQRLGLDGPQQVAEEAMLCVEGMIVRAQMGRDAAIVRAGRRLLARIERDARPANATLELSD